MYFDAFSILELFRESFKNFSTLPTNLRSLTNFSINSHPFLFFLRLFNILKLLFILPTNLHLQTSNSSFELSFLNLLNSNFSINHLFLQESFHMPSINLKLILLFASLEYSNILKFFNTLKLSSLQKPFYLFNKSTFKQILQHPGTSQRSFLLKKSFSPLFTPSNTFKFFNTSICFTKNLFACLLHNLHSNSSINFFNQQSVSPRIFSYALNKSTNSNSSIYFSINNPFLQEAFHMCSINPHIQTNSSTTLKLLNQPSLSPIIFAFNKSTFKFFK